MGSVYEDLEGHEGYGARRLADGALTSSWSTASMGVVAYVAACGCGWRGGDHPPTDDGYEQAVDEWDAEHARPLLERAVPARLAEAANDLRRELVALVDRRPAAVLAVAADLRAWADALAAQARQVRPAPAERAGARSKRRRLG